MLNRKTPLTRKKRWEKKPYKWERKTRIAPKSAKQKQRDVVYSKVQRAYLRVHRFCRVCTIVFGVSTRSSEVHHIRGRNGALLWDTRFFAATCRGCREWPHEHTVEARKLGLLALPQDWGVVPKKSTSF